MSLLQSSANLMNFHWKQYHGPRYTTSSIVEIYLQNTVLRVSHPSPNRPLRFYEIVGPTMNGSSCCVRSDSELPAGIPQNPEEAFISGAAACCEVDPPSNLLEVAKYLNELAGLTVDDSDAYMCENDDNVSTGGETTEMDEIVTSTDMFGDHSYALCPSLENTVDAASEGTYEDIPQPSGNLINCIYCGDKFYDTKYLKVHIIYQHQGKSGQPQQPNASPVKRNSATFSNQENVFDEDQTEKPSTTNSRNHAEVIQTPVYECFVRNCNYRSFFESNLRKHISKDHSEDTKRYRCIACVDHDVVIRKAYNFYEHYRQHDRAKLFKCSLCSQKFWEHSSMKMHFSQCPYA